MCACLEGLESPITFKYLDEGQAAKGKIEKRLPCRIALS